MSGQGMTLRSKLLATTAGTVMALIVLFAALLINGKSQMLADRQDKVRNLVEVAHATVANYEQEARAGRLSVEEAKKAAMAAVKAMRYDKVEYFWINDLNDLMVMHPIKPELDGKKLDQLKDKNGKTFFPGYEQCGEEPGWRFRRLPVA